VWDFRAQRRSTLMRWQWCVILIPFWTRCARWLLRQEPTNKDGEKVSVSFSCSFLSINSWPHHNSRPPFLYFDIFTPNTLGASRTVIHLKQIMNTVRSTKHNCFRSGMRHASPDHFAFQEDADPLLTWFCLLVVELVSSSFRSGHLV
jgi:hypothetical protein